MNYNVSKDDFEDNYYLLYRHPIILYLRQLNERNLEFDISKLKYTGKYIIDIRECLILCNITSLFSSPHIKYMESFHFVEFTSNKPTSIIAKMEKTEDGSIFICFYVNLDLLNSKIDYFLSNLLKLSEIEKEKQIVNNFIENVKNPIKFNYNKELLSNEKWLDYKNMWQLYNYQKDDILFMENIEETVNSKYLNVYEVPGFYKFKGCKFNLKGRRFNTEYPLFYEKLDLKGGCLINEMGLGKTLEMFELISRTKMEFDENFKLVKSVGECNYFFKRGKNAGSSCGKKNADANYFCKDHSNTLFIDKMKTVVENKEEFKNYLKAELNKIDIFDKIEFKSNCTLIVCPTQLCDQWCTEFYEKYKDSNLLISMVSSIDTFRNTTLEELLLLDVLIIPYNLFQNVKYLNLKEYKTELINIWNSKFSSIFWDVKDRHNFIDENVDIIKIRNSINLSNIKFKRIVLDEFHEILKPNLLEILNNLKSKYKWILTGTPFLNETKSIRQYFNFLADGKLYNYKYDIPRYKIDYDNIPKIFKRNTKESIKNEWSCTKIDTIYNVIDFTEIESIIYRSYKEQLNQSTERNKNNIIMNLLKICCCGDLLSNNLKLKIDNCKTFEEIQKVILDENETILNNLFMRIMETENEIEQLSSQLEVDLKVNLANKKRNLTNLSKEYESVNRGQIYLKSVMKSINDKEDWECAICLAESEDIMDIGITKCGHKFCWECLLFSIENCRRYNNMINCPQCKTDLRNDEYFLIKNTKEKVVESNELTELVKKTKSSKIGNIINYLKTKLEVNDHCIIFSQWDYLLKKVGDYIKNNGINVVYCSGTIYQKKVSIKRFNEDSDDTRIIMLSSENSASGLNLTKANKIIFIEPVYGTQIRKVDIENQAIGRANRIGQKNNIEIIKFIIKDTIEEDILNGKEVNVDNILSLVN